MPLRRRHVVGALDDPARLHAAQHDTEDTLVRAANSTATTLRPLIREPPQRRLELLELLDMPADGIMAANPKKPRKRARNDGSGGGSGKRRWQWQARDEDGSHT